MLAAIGLYGAISYAVSRRTREIGIRMALGASSSGIIRLVVAQGLTLTAVGIAGGLMAAFGLTRFIASLLVGVSSTDPLIFGGVSVMWCLVAIVASYIPARRAVKVEPKEALRYD